MEEGKKLNRAAFDAAYWTGQGAYGSDDVTDTDRDEFYADYLKSTHYWISDYRKATVFIGDGKEFAMTLESLAF